MSDNRVKSPAGVKVKSKLGGVKGKRIDWRGSRTSDRMGRMKGRGMTG